MKCGRMVSIALALRAGVDAEAPRGGRLDEADRGKALTKAIQMCLGPEDLERLGKRERAVPSALTVAYS